MVLFSFILFCPAVDSVGQDQEALLQPCHPNMKISAIRSSLCVLLYPPAEGYKQDS